MDSHARPVPGATPRLTTGLWSYTLLRVMEQMTRLGFVALCASVTACSATDTPAFDETEGSTTASSTGGADGEGVSTGPGPSGPSDSSGTGDITVELGPCAQLAGCATALGELVTPLLGVYGEQGTCWSEFEASACRQDCIALLADYRLLDPEAAECLECADASDCAYDQQFDSCVDGVCRGPEAEPPEPPPVDCSPVDFAAELQPIFDANCVDGCHSPGGDWGSLDYSEDAAAALVRANGIQTQNDPDLYLVAPGDLDDSYLVHKLRGTQAMRVGDGAGGQMPQGQDPLPEHVIARIEEWVLCLE